MGSHLLSDCGRIDAGGCTIEQLREQNPSPDAATVAAWSAWCDAVTAAVTDSRKRLAGGVL